jgi:hypothetical protein
MIGIVGKQMPKYTQRRGGTWKELLFMHKNSMRHNEDTKND